MSELRVPDIPLPRPFLRVISEDPVTKEDLERLRRNLQQTIDNLQGELRREKELTKKLEKSGAILQEILAAPDFRALSMKSAAATTIAEAVIPAQGARADEPPVEYVEVTEIELTDAELSKQETKPAEKKAP